MMTLNRYLLVGKDHAPWLVTLAKLEFKWVIRGSFLLSGLINIGHAFEYEIREDMLETLHLLNQKCINNGIIYTQKEYSDYIYPIPNACDWYFYYTCVYFCINFGVFFIVNTAIEIKIVLRMHQELKEKRERQAKMNSSATKSATSVADDIRNAKKAKEDETKERRVIEMVVFNSILNLILRAPDMLFWLESTEILSDLFSSDYISFLAYFHGFANLLVDASYFMYIMSFSTNFAIFYYFNSKFSEAVVFFSSKQKIKK
jgi:hypothetical protein